MPHPNRQAVVRWAVTVICCLVVVYPLSYALVVKWMLSRPSDAWWINGRELPAYKPVDWLIDHTPLKQPMFAWAKVWGVYDEFVLAAAGRPLPHVPIDDAAPIQPQ